MVYPNLCHISGTAKIEYNFEITHKINLEGLKLISD